MKANELMIGDWVEIKTYGISDKYERTEAYIYVKVAGIDSGFITVEYNNDIKEQYRICENTEIEPIPLTAEILEKNGWVRTKYSYGRDCMEIHGADELPEGVDNTLSMARWSIDKNYQYHFLGLYMWVGSVMQHDVHYVHQLQHAFRIFGIEKEIIL